MMLLYCLVYYQIFEDISIDCARFRVLSGRVFLYKYSLQGMLLLYTHFCKCSATLQNIKRDHHDTSSLASLEISECINPVAVQTCDREYMALLLKVTLPLLEDKFFQQPTSPEIPTDRPFMANAVCFCLYLYARFSGVRTP